MSSQLEEPASGLLPSSVRSQRGPRPQISESRLQAASPPNSKIRITSPSCLVPPTLGLVAAPAVATSVIPRYRGTFAVDQTSLNQVLPLGSLRPGDCCVDDTTRPVASGFKLGMGGAESRSSHRPRRGAARPDSWSGGLLGTCLNMLLYFCSREKGKARGPYQQAAWEGREKRMLEQGSFDSNLAAGEGRGEARGS